MDMDPDSAGTLSEASPFHIVLHDGRYFRLDDPQRTFLDPETIAHGLSMVCRFSGQIPQYYSVAQHCVELWRCVVRDPKAGPEKWTLGLWLLLHDAPEAFIGDMSRPMKEYMRSRSCLAYDNVEDRIMGLVIDEYGLDIRSPVVREARRLDACMLFVEKRFFFPHAPKWSREEEFIDHRLLLSGACLEPRCAKARWLDAYRETAVNMPLDWRGRSSRG